MRHVKYDRKITREEESQWVADILRDLRTADSQPLRNMKPDIWSCFVAEVGGKHSLDNGTLIFIPCVTPEMLGLELQGKVKDE